MASDTDRKVIKHLNEASRALANLMGELKSVTAGIEKGAVNASKVKAAQAKVAQYMKNYAKITKLQQSAAFAQLSPVVQDGVTWFDGVMGELLLLQDKGKWVEVTARLDPRKKPEDIIKAMERAQKQWQFKGLRMLVETAKKGLDNFQGRRGGDRLPAHGGPARDLSGGAEKEIPVPPEMGGCLDCAEIPVGEDCSPIRRKEPDLRLAHRLSEGFREKDGPQRQAGLLPQIRPFQGRGCEAEADRKSF